MPLQKVVPMPYRSSVRSTYVIVALAFAVGACQGDVGPSQHPVNERLKRLPAVATPVGFQAELQQLRDTGPVMLPSQPYGSLHGKASVDHMGAARYSLPFDVPPGVNGLTPSLGLSYSSGGANGLVGLGFSLSGVATMSRCRDTIADDGALAEIGFDNDDALCLNGQRLTLVSGSNGVPGSEYRTVRDPRTKIVLEAEEISERSSRWTVYLPDGDILRFNGDGEHAVVLNAENVPFKWLLTSREDRFANTIRYTWLTDTVAAEGTRDYRLQNVNYGAGLRVTLGYEVRNNDEMHGFEHGVRYARNHRLANVEVEAQSGGAYQTLHRYELEYEVHPPTQLSLLESVSKCDSSGTCLPPTTFDWSSVSPDLGGLVCDRASFTEEGGEAVLDWRDENFLAPPLSVTLDAFGDLRHETLHWDAAHNEWYLWSNRLPGDATEATGDPEATGDTQATGDWFKHYRAVRETNTALPRPPLPPEPPSPDTLVQIAVGQLDPCDVPGPHRYLCWPRSATYRPPFSASATHVFGRTAADVLVPVVGHEVPPGLDSEGLDAWGVQAITEFQVLSHATYNAVDNRVEFAVTAYDDGLDGQIYTVYPLDHNGDGLTDTWTCRGDGFKSGRWTLGLNQGGTTPPFAFEWHATDIPCSIHDEVLPIALHGDHRTSLLVVPAYDSTDTLADYDGNILAYMDGIVPIPDPQRNEFLRVDLEANTLQPTGLHHGYFQAWHDRSCANGAADAELGLPVYTAGQSASRVVDLNGDGYADVIVAELEVGDSYGNIDAIKHGLDSAPVNPLNPSTFKCELTQNQNLVLRAYINQGGHGFVPRTQPELTLSGLAHANYWINWQRAIAFDHDADGLQDFLLPGRGGGAVHGPAILSSQADGDYFLTGDPSPPDYYTGYYGGEAGEDEFTLPGRGFTTNDGHTLIFVGLDEHELCPLGSVAQVAGVHENNPQNRITLEAVTDGFGAQTRFNYEASEVDGRSFQGPRPAGRNRRRTTVVREMAVQVGPSIDGDEAPFARTRYDYSGPLWNDHGRGFVGYASVRTSMLRPDEEGGGAYAETRQYYDQTFNNELQDYPYVGRPRLSESVSYNSAPDGSQQRVVSCEEVEEWGLVRPYAEQTWFSYPRRVRSYSFSVLDNERTNDEGCDDTLGKWLLRDVTVTTELNEWGSTVSREVSSRDSLTGQFEITTTTFSEWVNDVDEWFVGKPQRTTTVSCLEEECVTRVAHRRYDSARHTLRLAVREPEASDTTHLSTTFTYTDHGNLATVSVAGFGEIAPRVTTTTWEPQGRFPLSTTNPVGHTSYLAHDELSRIAFATVDPNGVTIRTDFDTFYRGVRERRLSSPLGAGDGVVSQVSFGPADAALGAVMTTSEQVLGQDVRTEVGPTGRVLRKTWRGVVESQEFPVPDDGPQAGDIYFLNEYDARGRLARTSHNTVLGEDPEYWTVGSYDDQSQKTRSVIVDAEGLEVPGTERRWGRQVGTGWNGGRTPRESFYRDEEGNETRSLIDHKGRTVVAVDAAGTALCKQYGAYGRVVQVQRNCGLTAVGPQPTTTYTYDTLNRTLTETDPAFGTRSKTYSSYGEVTSADDAKGQFVEYHRDALGRVERKVAPEGESRWVYDQDQIGTLSSTKGPDSITRSWSYDEFGRVASETTQLPPLAKLQPDPVTVRYRYDVGDRVNAIGFDSQVVLEYHHDLIGQHRSTHISSAENNWEQEFVWGWERADAHGAITHEVFGNGASPADRGRTRRMYDPVTGRLEASTTFAQGAQVQAYSFGWSPSGDLDWRLDSHTGQYEVFEHDELHRLRESTVAGVARTFEYDVLGNFTFKDGIGEYQYGPHGARLQYTSNGSTSTTYVHDPNGSVESFGDTNLSWTSFGKLREVSQGSATRRMLYDADGARVIRSSQEGFTVTAHGLYERRYDAKGRPLEARIKATGAAGNVVAEFRFDFTNPLAGGLGKTVTKAGTSLAWASTQYVHDDHLGSASLTTDENGEEVERVGYDAWGRQRDADDWNLYLADDAVSNLPVGFTGHQAELDSGLINMGGRMYDPRLGRFMSVDPVVANALNTQAWNSFANVLNQVLRLTDPSGYSPEGGGGSAPGEDAQDLNPPDECPERADTDCRTVHITPLDSSADPFSGPGAGGGSAPAGYWGASDGSGIGMRNHNALMRELRGLAARRQFEDEIQLREAMGYSCSVTGGTGTCTMTFDSESWKEKMAGALALLSGLNVAGEGIAATTALGDGVEIVDAIVAGDGEAAVQSAVLAAVGLLPGGKLFGKGAKAAKRVANGADAAGDASKVGKKACAGGRCTPDGGCFVAGTLVEIERGLVPIETVVPGDRSWSFDAETGEWGWHHVKDAWERVDRGGLVHIEVGGEEISATAAHPFCVLDGDQLWDRPRPRSLDDREFRCGTALSGRWVDALEVREGDLLESSTAARLVDGVDYDEGPAIVFNFSVEGARSYVVGERGFLVHNNEDCAEAIAEALGPPRSSRGRRGAQARKREIADDPKVSSRVRGWLRQEMNQIARGTRKSVRNPPGTELAHARGREAAKGFSHTDSPSNLVDKGLHDLQHKHDDFGRKNRTR